MNEIVYLVGHSSYIRKAEDGKYKIRIYTRTGPIKVTIPEKLLPKPKTKINNRLLCIEAVVKVNMANKEYFEALQILK